MKTTRLLVAILVIVSLTNCKLNKTTDNTLPVVVEINYGQNQISKQTNLKWEQGMTALTALEHAANVETHPLGKYVFVTAIDSVQGIRGIKAWYYTVNRQHPKVLAINNTIHPGDTIAWVYTKDVCSCKVDGWRK